MHIERGCRVVVAADDQLFARGLRTLLEENGFTAYCVDSSVRAERMLDVERRDVVLLAFDFLDRQALSQAGDLRRARHGARICLLANGADTKALRGLLAHGTRDLAVVLRSQCREVGELVDVIYALHEGRNYVEPAVLDRLLASAARPEDRFADLSCTERQVLELMARGLRNSEIARRMWKTEKAVEKSVARLFAKLGLDATTCPHLDRRVVAARIYLRHATDEEESEIEQTIEPRWRLAHGVGH